MTTDQLFAEWRLLERIAKITGKKGDHEAAQEAHKAWKAAVARLGALA